MAEPVEVGVLDTLVVCVVVAVLVIVVEGVVISQFSRVPSWYASTAAFRVCAVASQPERSSRNLPKAHVTVSLAPSGPRYSRASALMAAAVAPHDAASMRTPLDTPDVEGAHCTVPDSVGQVPRTRFSTSTCR